MKKILLIMPKGFELLEAAAFTDVAGWVRDVLKEEIYTVICGLTHEVNASFGNVLSSNIIKTDILIDDVEESDFDALALPGGFGKYGYFESGFDERVLKLVRDFDSQKKPIGAVCTAALVLAKSGILDGRKATTYYHDNGMYVRQLSEYNIEVIEEKIVVNGNVITSSGPQTAPHVAIKLIEMLTGKEVSEEVATVMGYNPYE